MKKVVSIKCTALGKYLANSSAQGDEKASFELQVSTKTAAAATASGDWTKVTTYLTSTTPITEQNLTEEKLGEILQGSDKTIKLQLDSNVQSYRILASCSLCPWSDQQEVARGNFPGI